MPYTQGGAGTGDTHTHPHPSPERGAGFINSDIIIINHAAERVPEFLQHSSGTAPRGDGGSTP